MTIALPYDLQGKRVWVAGEYGMVGSALVRRLASEGCELLRLPRRAIDFRNQATTSAWIRAARPDAVYIAAAKVGGIAANAANMPNRRRRADGLGCRKPRGRHQTRLFRRHRERA